MCGPYLCNCPHRLRLLPGSCPAGFRICFSYILTIEIPLPPPLSQPLAHLVTNPPDTTAAANSPLVNRFSLASSLLPCPTNEEQNTTSIQRLSGPRRRPQNRHQSPLESEDLLALAAKKAMHQRRAKHPWYPAIFCAPPATTEHTKPRPSSRHACTSTCTPVQTALQSRRTLRH